MPIIQRLVAIYKLWHQFQPHIPKISRYSLGGRIDTVLIETIEAIFATMSVGKENKLLHLNFASKKLEALKFLLQVAWEIQALDDKKYISLSEQLNEVGRMIGGWTKKIQKETP